MPETTNGSSPTARGAEAKSLLASEGDASFNSQNKSATSKLSLYMSSKTLDKKKIVSVVVLIALAGFVLLAGNNSSGSNNNTEIHQTLHNDKRANDVIPKELLVHAGVSDKKGSEDDPDPVTTNVRTETKKETEPATSATADKDSNFKSTLQTLTARFAAAQKDLLATLHKNYGAPAAEAMFQIKPQDGSSSSSFTTIARTLFRSGDPGSSVSWDRAKRKLMMKLLMASSSSKTTTFVWATGGHSAAAGHGNFYDESYTAFMERAVKDVFAAVNMEFIGRNYAMGGTGSAMEIALCGDQIFGLDADIVSWDFGMTDGSRYPWREEIFHRRTAGSNPNRPIGVAMHTGKGRSGLAQSLEDVGLAILTEDPVLHAQIQDAIPDSFGKTDQELEAMPPYIRNMRCGDKIENGEPYCGAQKYNMTDCVKRKFRAGWHPGWKYHAVMGTAMGLLLMELLGDALKELAVASVNDPAALLQALQASEDSDYEKYHTTPVDANLYRVSIKEASDQEGFDFTLLTKGEMFCHTARLPAEIRHKGILTESTKTGFTTFDAGVALREALTAPDASSSLMRLVYEPDARQTCPIPTNMDYKDFFLVSGAEGWRSLMLPNNAELKEYGKGQEKPNLKGYVAICFAGCAWGKCPRNVLQPGHFAEGKFELTVNGKSVDRLSSFTDCVVLYSQESGYTWQPNVDGRLEVAARVTEKASFADFLRFSSIIVW